MQFISTFLSMLFIRAENFVSDLQSEERGQTLVEYALIIALIAVIAIVAIALVGTKVSDAFNYIAGKLTIGGS